MRERGRDRIEGGQDSRKKRLRESVIEGEGEGVGEGGGQERERKRSVKES